MVILATNIACGHACTPDDVANMHDNVVQHGGHTTASGSIIGQHAAMVYSIHVFDIKHPVSKQGVL